MNEKVKKVFKYIAGIFISISSFLLGIFLCNHRNSDERTEELAEDISRTGDRISEANGRFEETNKRFGSIIEEIEKTKHDSND